MSSVIKFDDIYNKAIKDKSTGGHGLTEQRATQFALNSCPQSGVSFYIHMVFNNISFVRIKNLFIQMRWGFIDRVDVIHRGSHKSAFIHFRPGSFNIGNRDAMNALEAAIECKEVKIVYDTPWFWKLQISTVSKTDEPPKPPPSAVLVIGGAGKGGGRSHQKPAPVLTLSDAFTSAISRVEPAESKEEDSAPVESGTKKTLVESFSGLPGFLKGCNGKSSVEVGQREEQEEGEV